MKKGIFLKKSPTPPPSPYSIPFLKVLYQNKTLHNSPKGGQHSIVKRNVGLEYALNTIQKNFKSLFNH